MQWSTHKEWAHFFKTLGPMVSIPEDLSESRELSTSNISCSDMSIETKCSLTEVSTLALLFVDMRLATSGKNWEENLLNSSMALLTLSVALVSPKWTVFGIEVDILMFHKYLYIFDWFLKTKLLISLFSYSDFAELIGITEAYQFVLVGDLWYFFLNDRIQFIWCCIDEVKY